MQRRTGVVLGVIAVVLAIVALMGPWWVVNSQTRLGGGFTAVGQTDYALFGRTDATQSNLSSSTNTSTYGDLPQTGSVFSLAAVLTVLGLVLGIGTVVIGALSGSNPSFRRFAMIAGILAFLVLLVAPLYVLSALPAAVNRDAGASALPYSGFWGTKSGTFGIFVSYSVTWAAGWAWYVAVVAAIIFLVASVAIAASRAPAGMVLRAPPPPP